MTPTEKAKELVKSYALLTWKGKEFHFEYYKQCALITVNEMLNNFLSNRTTNYGRERYHFWQKVKLEIEKL